MWRVLGAVVLVLCGASTLPFGAWVIGKSRLPSWIKGFWKWPLGDNLTPEVANLQGWAAVLVGTAALVALVPVLRLPDRSATSRASLAIVVLFLIVSVVAVVRSIVLSHRAPATPPGSGLASAMGRENALAVGMVAGLVLGALLTAGVYDAFPGEATHTNQTGPTPRASSLQWTDVRMGSGTIATTGKLVKIQYTIWLGDGTRIDSSNSFTFTMGKGEVIKGLDDGMVGMRVGGVRWLIVPPALAYGASDVIATPGPSIPPNSTLVFVVTLLSVGP